MNAGTIILILTIVLMPLLSHLAPDTHLQPRAGPLFLSPDDY